MVTVDHAALEASLAKFNRSIALKIEVLHSTARQVVKVEAGRLVQTLIHITPPSNRAKTGKEIESRVTRKFHLLENALTDSQVSGGDPSKSGSGDVRWYAFTPDAIYGVAKEKDLTQASVEELYRFYKAAKITRSGKMTVGRRGKQAVRIWQKVTAKKETVAKVIKRIIGNLGRAKSGWLDAWEKLGRPSKMGGAPQYVTKHGKDRGYAIDGLGAPDGPQFTLENHAFKIGSPEATRLIGRALEIRAKAMTDRLSFLVKFPEKIAEESA